MVNPFTLVPLDKSDHFFAGLSIALIVALFSNPIAGVCAALAVGAFKEWVIDGWMKWGQFDPWDFAATCFGGCVVPVLYFVFSLTGHLA